MFISDEEFEKRVNKNLELRQGPSGRPNGKTNVPMLMKALIGIAGRLDGNASEAGRAFGIPAAAAARYVKGKTSEQAPPNAELVDKINKGLGVVTDKALDRLMKSLDLMDDEKLEETRARDLSLIAANMSKVIDRTKPIDTESRAPQIIVYAPKLHQENFYEVVPSPD